MDYPWAVPGAWVVCVSTDVPDGRDLEIMKRLNITRLPVVGEKYQIYDVQEHPVEKGRIGLRLVGFTPFLVFDIIHFRPLVEEDAKMFEAMLKDIPAEETQDA